jgi:hypothetical protein
VRGAPLTSPSRECGREVRKREASAGSNLSAAHLHHHVAVRQRVHPPTASSRAHHVTRAHSHGLRWTTSQEQEGLAVTLQERHQLTTVATAQRLYQVEAQLTRLASERRSPTAVDTLISAHGGDVGGAHSTGAGWAARAASQNTPTSAYSSQHLAERRGLTALEPPSTSHRWTGDSPSPRSPLGSPAAVDTATLLRRRLDAHAGPGSPSWLGHTTRSRLGSPRAMGSPRASAALQGLSDLLADL